MNEEISLSVEDQAFSIDNGTTVYTKKFDARSEKSGTRKDSENTYLSLRIKRCARRGYSVDKLAGYIAKHNPLFPVEQKDAFCGKESYFLLDTKYITLQISHE